MADNYIIPVTLFGNYSVTGDLLLLGNITCKNVASSLYYNQSSRSYFLVKTYGSGKVHIDFFNKTIRHDLDYAIHPDNRQFKFIAEYQSKDNSITKYLSYCNKAKTYIISTVQDGVKYTITLAKNTLLFDDMMDMQ